VSWGTLNLNAVTDGGVLALLATNPASRPLVDTIVRYANALQGRLWVKRGVRLALRTIAVVAVLLIAARVLAAFGVVGAADAILLLALVAAIGGTVAVVRSRPTVASAAREADRALGLRERLGTSLELSAKPAASSLGDQLLVDTSERLARTTPNRVFGPVVPKRDAAFAAGGVLLALGLWVALPDLSTLVPQFGSPPAQEEQVTPPESSTGDLNENNVNDILGSIEDVRRQIQERSIDPSEAQRLLGEAEARLNSRIEASNRQQQNLQSLADQLRQTSVGQDIAGAIDRGDYSAAADQLNDLARESDQLSPTARRELAQALDRAAQQTQQNNGLRDAERRASQALNRGDYREIDRAMRGLGDQLGMAGRDVVPQTELGRAAGRLDQARQEAGLGEGQQGEGDQGQEGRGGNPTAGGMQQGNSPGGSLPGLAPGQNQQGQGGREAQPMPQGGQQQPGSGDQRPGELPQQDGSGERIGIGGKPVEIDGRDSGGQLRPSDGQGEQRGSQISSARPATGVGVAQPTEPVESPADFTRVTPDRRPAVRSYFTPNGP
jgi:hypothetical protein